MSAPNRPDAVAFRTVQEQRCTLQVVIVHIPFLRKHKRRRFSVRSFHQMDSEPQRSKPPDIGG